MSDFGLFDSFDSSESEQRTAAQHSRQTIDRAIHAVKEQFGPFLQASTSRDDFNDRVALVKSDMMKTVSAHLMPKPGVMRRVVASQKPTFEKEAFGWSNDFSDDPQNHQHGISDEQLEQDLLDDEDGTRDLHERGPMASKQADTTVDPGRPSTRFDDEGGTTTLDPTPEDTSPRDASKRTAGAQVGGNANIGDLVTYYDMANQTGEIWEVIALPGDASNVGPTGYIMNDYGLSSLSDERKHWSDLRQRGWTFWADAGIDFNTLASKIEAGTARVAEQGKALIPSKDWAGYLRDRAADGKKVRKHNFASLQEAAAARDFPELYADNADPTKIDPPLSGTNAQELSDHTESLDPDDVETQPRDASRKVSWYNFGGGLGGGYDFNVTSTQDGADGFLIWKWEILKGYRDEDVVMSGVIPQDQMDRYEIREFVEEQFVTYMRTAKRKRADTKVDPQHLPEDFDDEGGTTTLDPSGRDTSPRDARKQATRPFDRSRRADAGDAWRNQEDLEAERAPGGDIKHFADLYPNFVDGVEVSDADMEHRAEENLWEYEDWFKEVGSAQYTSHGLDSLWGWFAAEGTLMSDREKKATETEFSLSFMSSKTSAVRTAGFQESNWRWSTNEDDGAYWFTPDGREVIIQADYEDALYPDSNPRAIWDGEMIWVFGGTGELVGSKDAFDLSSAQSIGNKMLQKAYKGEASEMMKGQGKFFTTPGQGKLFGNRTAANISPSDVQHLGEGWYMYEPIGGAQLSLIEFDNDEWECEVAWPDGRFEDIVLNTWNDVDAVKAGVEFYNRVAGRRTASRTAAWGIQPIGQVGSTTRHAGWDWDNHLAGFVAQSGIDSFDCTCGQHIAAPSYKTCSCGKMWNSYPVKTADGAQKLICREIPVRDALLASKS